MADPLDAKASFEQRLADLRAATLASRNAVHRSHALIERMHRGSGRSGTGVATATAFKAFNAILETDGIRPALIYLHSLADYRYLSILRFPDGRARSVVHVDGTDLSIESFDEVPETATYCRFVNAGNRAFATVESRLDDRTEDHPARERLQAYCGIPILTPEGEPIGVLCHYDEAPRDPGQLDLELLLQVSSALAYSGDVPPYPTSDDTSTSRDPAAP